jgi:hypothetical protein
LKKSLSAIYILMLRRFTFAKPKLFAVLGFTFSSAFLFYHQQQQQHHQNYCNIAFAATTVPIGHGTNSDNSTSWNTNNNSKSTVPVSVDKNEDGICSYLFTQKSLPQEESSSFNSTGKAGISPLMIAAYTGNIKVCKQLLDEYGVDPELRSTTPQDSSLARKYFSNRFNLPEGFTALEVAVLGGNEECIKLMAEAVTQEVPPGNVADRMATIAANKGGMDLGKLQNALAEGRKLRKERLRKKRAQFPLEARLEEKLVGQKNAIQVISSAIRRKENGWHSEDSPLVMLELGSSGVGKTETAKIVAQYLVEGTQLSIGEQQVDNNNNENDDDGENQIPPEAQNLPPPFNQIIAQQFRSAAQQRRKQKRDKSNNNNNNTNSKENPCFIRIDMSEYQTKHEVAKIIGSAPGYVGYGEDNNLVGKLMKCPNAVVLFDEIEKANTDLLTVLLQLFDEGRLTDGTGKTVNCKDATFIMTSNLAQREIADEAIRLRQQGNLQEQQQQQQLLLSRDFKRNVIHPILRRHFGRDEFIGRINEIVFFLPFTESEQEQLTEKQMSLWMKRAKEKHNIELRFSHGVVKEVTKEYDLRYGARSLQFALDRMAISPIAKEHECGNVKPNTVVALRASADEPVLPEFIELAASENSSTTKIGIPCVVGGSTGFVMDVAELKPEKMMSNNQQNKKSNNNSGYFSKWFS